MRRLRKKNKKLIFIFLILMVSLVFMSTGYALLSQTHKITGTANIKGKTSPTENNFMVEPKIKDSWYDSSLYGYNISLIISNNSNYKSNGWEIGLDIPSDVSNIQCWVSNYSISNGRLTLTNLDYNGTIESGNTVEIGFLISTATKNYIPKNIVIKVFTDEHPEGIEFKMENSQDTDKDDEDEDSSDKETVDNDNAFDVNFSIIASWPSDNLYVTQYTVSLSNKINSNITSWKFDIINLDEFSFDTVWNANYIINDSALSLSNESYNSTIPTSGNISFTLQLKSTTKNYIPTVANKIYTN